MVRRHSAESRNPRAGAERATSTGEVTPAVPLTRCSSSSSLCFFTTSTHSELSPAEPPCDGVNTEQRLAPHWMSRDERKGKNRRPAQHVCGYEQRHPQMQLETQRHRVLWTGGQQDVCVNVITQ